MRQYLILIVGLILSITVFTSVLAAQRVALIIGNSAYKTAPLANPVNDAKDMAKALKKLGFQVILKTNATQRTMKNAVREFGKRLTNGGIALFYYSGHGLQYKNRNYLVPIKADIKSQVDIEFEGLDAYYVLQSLEKYNNNGVNIVILDACRNDPFKRSFRSLSKGLARMESAKGSLIAYSTSPGSVAEDGNGRNGTYTKHLLRALHDMPQLSIADLFIEVTAQVVKETNGKQVPWQSLSLVHRFCLAPCGGITPTPSPQQTVNPSVVNQPVVRTQYIAPDQFIRDYYAGINDRQYTKTWSLLSEDFKTKHNCCNRDGSYKYKSYTRWWNSIKRVDVRTAQIRRKNSKKATVIAKLRYTKKRGNRVVYQKHRFELVFDHEINNWLIDDQK